MKRAAIQLAKNTLVVSLPAKWVKANNVKKGDELDITERSHELVLTPGATDHTRKKVIDLSEWKVLHRRLLLNAYLQGNDEVEIRFTDPKAQRVAEVKELIPGDLIGFEIIKQTPTSIVIKEVSQPAAENFDLVFRRIFVLIESMAEELLAALQGNVKDLNHIVTMDKPINRFCNYAIRLLHKQGHADYWKIPALYSIVQILERTADCYKGLALCIMQNKIKITKDYVDNIQAINRLFSSFRDALLFYDKAKLHKFIALYEETTNRINRKELPSTRYLHQILEYIIMMNNDLLVMH